MRSKPQSVLPEADKDNLAVEQKGEIYPLGNRSLAECCAAAADDRFGEGSDDNGSDGQWEKFFTHLARRTNLEAALKASGLSAEQALRARTDDKEMALRWQQALAAGYDDLEMDLLYRARYGTEKPVYYGGKRIDTVQEYDNGVALRLLAQHRKEHAERQSGAGPQENAIDVLRERLLAYRQKVEGAQGGGSETKAETD